MRQMLGGGIRQGGVLAAACLVALDGIGDLANTHTDAQRLADGLREFGWDVTTPQTNIVLARVADVPATLSRLASLEILALPMSGKIRFVTHRDLASNAIEESLRRIKTALAT